MISKEAQILGDLLPSHPDFLPFLNRIREEYDLPTGGIIDKEFLLYDLSDREIPWEKIRDELADGIRNAPDLWDEKIIALVDMAHKEPDALDNPSLLMQEMGIEETKQTRIIFQAMLQQLKPIVLKFDEFISSVANMLLIWLSTGESEAAPFDWFASVIVDKVMGEPVVVAIAGPMTDPKEVAAKFTAEHRRLFGKDRYRISQEFLNNADLLRMKFEGVALKDIADEYIQRNRSQFPKDESSRAYKQRKRRLEETLKKRLRRHEATLLKMIGDDKPKK